MLSSLVKASAKRKIDNSGLIYVSRFVVLFTLTVSLVLALSHVRGAQRPEDCPMFILSLQSALQTDGHINCGHFNSPLPQLLYTFPLYTLYHACGSRSTTILMTFVLNIFLLLFTPPDSSKFGPHRVAIVLVLLTGWSDYADISRVTSWLRFLLWPNVSSFLLLRSHFFMSEGSD